MTEINEQSAPAEPDPQSTDGSLELGDCDPFFIIDDEPEDEGDIANSTSPQDELDALRIRQVVRLRRANIRSQTYGIVGTIVCAVAAVKLALMAYHRYQLEQWKFCCAFAASSIAAAIAALIFATYVDRLRDDLHRPENDFQHTPDFEALSDGSHHVRNLEDMHS